MQLDAPVRPSSLRSRLGAAACMLIAVGAPPAVAGTPADSASTAPTWQFDGSALFYGEQDRVNVFEPVGRIMRLLPNGQTLSAQMALDGISGASPTGALPSGQATTQTTTSASGNTSTTTTGGQIPTHTFRDVRGALDLGWQVPLGTLVVPGIAFHVSREKDYQSLGMSGNVAIDLMHRLTTLTLGGGFNQDGVFPVGGTRLARDSTGALLTTNTNDKQVVTTLIGLSRILTRRWMVGANVSRTLETGYLTEPYKVVSVVDPTTGYIVGQFTENRPTSRSREDVLASSVYHFTNDVLYTSYRYYWDDWGVTSHTIDVKYRYELAGDSFVQPHVRFYTQTSADFFHYAVVHGTPLPTYLTADDRLGPLQTATVGATYGFRVPNYPGELTVRAEYMRWWGDGSPATAVGVQRTLDLFPAVNIGSLVVGYSVQF